MRTKGPISFALFVTVIVAASFASAQTIARIPIWRDVPLAMQTSIQEELHLSDSQKESITKLNDKVTAELSDLGQLGLTPQERIPASAELTAQHTKALEAILQPQQFERFNEIAIQYWTSIEAASILANQLSDKLSVTDEQKTKLMDLGKEQRSAHYKKLAGTPFSEMDQQARALCAEEKAEALRILTAEQKRIFDILQGDEFDLKTIDDYAKPKKK